MFRNCVGILQEQHLPNCCIKSKILTKSFVNMVLHDGHVGTKMLINYIQVTKSVLILFPLISVNETSAFHPSPPSKQQCVYTSKTLGWH